MEPVNIERCQKAMQHIMVTGRITAKTEIRMRAIEDAISWIQEDPENALRDRYIGVKNYASFGDQREDCAYGRGPRHGSIVFRIARTVAGERYSLGPDDVYLLECVRDAGTIQVVDDGGKLNFSEALKQYLKHESLSRAYLTAIEAVKVDSHGG
jgi:hypothetical protein